MCLALPARVVHRLPEDQAVVDMGGVRKTISLALVEQAQPGDYVIVHVGHAIGLLDAEEAEQTLALFAAIAAADAQADPPVHVPTGATGHRP
jgi:hydrogenase expression/formation protein HypC